MQNKLILRVRPTSDCTKNIPLGNKCGHPYVSRVNLGGNYCGHYPDSPTLNILVDFPKGFPEVLIKFSEWTETYYANPKAIPSLNATNRSPKQQSSARREACIRLLKATYLNTELVTMRCGIPSEEGFAPLTLNVLAKRAGLSLSRAKRAMNCCKRAGLLSVIELTVFDDLTGKYKGVPAIKKLNAVFFNLCGLGEMLKRARKAAYKRLQKNMGEHAKTSVKDIANIQLMLAGSANSSNKQQSKDVKKDVPHQKNRTELFKSIYEDNPYLPIEEIFELVKAASTAS